ncbi:hypothetical protein LR48_Vigan424s000400 [Vigna angularis]|uniref:Uncharacterized protein n=1 Tax=Phaseolus angularis TaxID=3914 RepID=A0A0L9TAD6_PHAAN|nr:hypothetical protein LR48_Vigan424s000400 [Vigna angularis]
MVLHGESSILADSLCHSRFSLVTASSTILDPSDSLGFLVRLELEFSFSFESVFDLVFSSSFSTFCCVLLVGGSFEEVWFVLTQLQSASPRAFVHQVVSEPGSSTLQR